MGNQIFTFGDCARARRLLRAVIAGKGQTVSGAYEEACYALQMMSDELGAQGFGRPPGTYVDARNEVRVIPNSVPRDEPIVRPLLPVGLDSADDVEARPTRFDPVELTEPPLLAPVEGFDSEQLVGVLPDLQPEPEYDPDDEEGDDAV